MFALVMIEDRARQRRGYHDSVPALRIPTSVDTYLPEIIRELFQAGEQPLDLGRLLIALAGSDPAARNTFKKACEDPEGTGLVDVSPNLC
jgi:hypothetical protein